MTKDEALRLIGEYCDATYELDFGPHYRKQKVLHDAQKMNTRFPEDGSENKAMRWLGYLQGVLVANLIYTKEEVKKHSHHKKVSPPWPAPDVMLDAAKECEVAHQAVLQALEAQRRCSEAYKKAWSEHNDACKEHGQNDKA